MLKPGKATLWVFIWSVLFFVLSNISYGQTPEQPDILNSRITWEIANPNIYQACFILGSKGIPIGIEQPSSEAVKYEHTLNLKSGSLREILDSLVKQEPDFTWEIRDGVVNVYPIHARDEILKDLLNVKLQRISINLKENPQRLVDNIGNSEPLKSFLELKQVKLYSAYLENFKPESIKAIEATEIDLRGILNNIVKNSTGSKRWLVKSSKGEILILF